MKCPGALAAAVSAFPKAARSCECSFIPRKQERGDRKILAAILRGECRRPTDNLAEFMAKERIPRHRSQIRLVA